MVSACHDHELLQDAELLEAGRRLAEAQGALSVADSTDAALAAAREEAAASREQYQVSSCVTFTSSSTVPVRCCCSRKSHILLALHLQLLQATRCRLLPPV
jgi:hypothetical protein